MINAIVVVLVLIADQAMKFWTTKNILLGAVGDECAALFPGVVHITNVHNYGAAFSILQNARWPLIIVTIIFIVVIIVLMNREIIHTPFGRWTATLVLAGAIGNCIDRMLYGYVVDMFEFEFFSFPVFNVADIFITVAGILFCIHLIAHNEPEAVKAANEPEFMRRRREAQKAKDEPFANIPKHGEHKSLEDELGAFDPDDPFGEWEFGSALSENEAAPVSEPEPESVSEPEPEPKAAPKPLPSEVKDDLFSSFLFEPGSGEGFGFAPEATPGHIEEPEAAEEQPAEPEPVSEPEIRPEENTPSVFSLEDILSEFGDI